jgi:hypothetical protein
MSAIEISQNEIPTKSSGLSTADDAAADVLHNANTAPEVAAAAALDPRCLVITRISPKLLFYRMSKRLSQLFPSPRLKSKQNKIGIAPLFNPVCHRDWTRLLEPVTPKLKRPKKTGFCLCQIKILMRLKQPEGRNGLRTQIVDEPLSWETGVSGGERQAGYGPEHDFECANGVRELNYRDDVAKGVVSPFGAPH